LKEYEGTLLIVSHDRYLINSLADKIYYLTPTGIEVFEGNYDEFLKKFEPFRENEKPVEEKTEKQTEYKNKKERDALRRKAKARIARLETEIAEKEDMINSLNESLNDTEISSSYEKALEVTNRIEQEQRKLDSLYSEWEELSESV